MLIDAISVYYQQVVNSELIHQLLETKVRITFYGFQRGETIFV